MKLNQLHPRCNLTRQVDVGREILDSTPPMPKLACGLSGEKDLIPFLELGVGIYTCGNGSIVCRSLMTVDISFGIALLVADLYVLDGMD